MAEPKTIKDLLLKELQDEAPATRKCLERMQPDLFDWKPHEKSMQMGYLALLLAEMPRWISMMVEVGEINFGTFKHEEAKTVEGLLKQFDANMVKAEEVVKNASEETLLLKFSLKSGEQVLMEGSRQTMAASSINHWVHHRGQFTVYLRLNNIPVPSIYGPSADDKTF